MFRQFILIVALVTASLAFKHEMAEEDKKVMEECVKELGYEIPKHNKDQNVTAEDRKKISCMMKCNGIKGGVISEDGVLNAEKIKEKMPLLDTSKIKEAMETCKDKTGGDECSKISSKIGCMFHELMPKKDPK